VALDRADRAFMPANEHLPPLLTRLLPPGSPLARARRLFLLFALLACALAVPMVATAPGATAGLRIVGIAAIGVLAALWIESAKRGRLPALYEPIEFAAIFAVSVAGMPERALGLVYAGILRRSLYGSPRRVALGWAVYSSAHMLAIAVAGEGSYAFTDGLAQIAPLAVAAGIMHGLGEVMTRYHLERTRQRILREASAALVTARDRDAIHRAALRAMEQLAGPSLSAAAVALRAGAGFTVPAASGDWLPGVAALRVPLAELPPDVVDDVAAGRVHAGATPRTLGLDLFAPPDLAGQAGVIVPLTVRDEARGALALFGPDLADAGLRESLAGLAADVALSLEAADLVEARLTQETEERFGAILESSSDVVLVVEADTAIRYVTPAVERVLGWKPAEVVGTPLIDLVHPDDRAWAASSFTETLKKPGPAEGVLACRWKHRDGTWRDIESTRNNQLYDADIGAVIMGSRDVSDRVALENQLAHRAFHDPLTDLANRALFTDRLEHALAAGERRGELVAVLFVDLDDFKNVNDSLGHAAGDELLVAVGGRLRKGLRTGDTVARFGGDEFAVLLEAVPDITAVETIAASVFGSLDRPFSIGGREVVVKASVGIAVADPSAGATTGDVLMRNADIALYRAKTDGKGRHRLFEQSMHSDAMRRIGLEADLRRAIDREELLLHYQPIVNLRSGRIVGIEALVRWKHHSEGLLAPKEFVPLAEDTAMIVPLGAWVLSEATRRLRGWHDRYADRAPLQMCVNLSALQLTRPELADEIGTVIRTAGIEPRNLVLEITQSASGDDPEALGRRLRDLKGLGVRVALDDFGTGWSSLSMLSSLSIDILKIPRSFVDGVARDGDEMALARGIIELGRGLDLQLVAEGIETPDQLKRLQTLGCEFGQGYLIAHPQDGDRLTTLLDRSPSLDLPGNGSGATGEAVPRMN
jgi:diguanylate cyclase (GGDEF)-like protein/PAS domain S-box-containing protein